MQSVVDPAGGLMAHARKAVPRHPAKTFGAVVFRQRRLQRLAH